ncbi:MAG: hypothetical protein KDA27_26710, partial [Candidatus Eisenbacteria bacterium]|nr:hypothetical protein [Candidatus Eisenbacteria bacterium]
MLGSLMSCLRSSGRTGAADVAVFEVAVATAAATAAVVACLSVIPTTSVAGRLWMTNYVGGVQATAVRGDTLFIGGDFDELLPYTGSAAPIDPVTGITVGSPSPVRSVTT